MQILLYAAKASSVQPKITVHVLVFYRICILVTQGSGIFLSAPSDLFLKSALKAGLKGFEPLAYGLRVRRYS